MSRISLNHIKSGMILAKTIYTDDGRVLLSEGVELKEQYIARLVDCNILKVYVEDEISDGVVVKDVISEKTRLETKMLVRNIMEDCKAKAQFESEAVKEAVQRIIDELIENPHIIYNLSDIRSMDNYTFSHSVNVCVLSLITGIRLGMTQPELICIGTGSILHDVGKVAVSEQLLKKPCELDDDEFEEIKKHTIYGYDIVKRSEGISPESQIVVLEHHERMDGSGYPLGLKGECIHPFSKIVAVADVYDALTSDRIYRRKVKPYKVVEYLTNPCIKHFDSTVIRSFIKTIAIYPLGTGVVLNTGEKGIVVKLNSAHPTRPVVRIIFNADGEAKKSYEEVDLEKFKSLLIIDTCEF